MKKTVGKFAAIVLAFLMVFSLTGCGMVKVNSTAEALSGMADAMLEQKGITATADITMQIGEVQMPYKLTAKLAKQKNDYDYSVKAQIALGGMSFETMNVTKKGNKLYTKITGTTNYYEDDAETVDISGIEDQIKDVLSGFDSGKFKKDGKTYVLTYGDNYATALKSVISGVLTIKDENACEFLCENLGIEADELEAFINTAFADDVTIETMLGAVDTMLGTIKSGDTELTLEALLAMQGITAQDVYEAIHEYDETVEQPKAGQSAYAYLIYLYGDMKVDDLLSFIDMGSGNETDGDYEYSEYDIAEGEEPELTVGYIRETLNEALGFGESDGYTIGEIYDEFAGALNDVVGTVTEICGSTGVYEAMLEDGKGAALCTANLEKLKINKLDYTVKIVLNGKDLTIKEIKASFNIDIKYGEEYNVALAKVSVNAEFEYDKVSISAPSKSLIVDRDDTDWEYGDDAWELAA